MKNNFNSVSIQVSPQPQTLYNNQTAHPVIENPQNSYYNCFSYRIKNDCMTQMCCVVFSVMIIITGILLHLFVNMNNNAIFIILFGCILFFISICYRTKSGNQQNQNSQSTVFPRRHNDF